MLVVQLLEQFSNKYSESRQDFRLITNRCETLDEFRYAKSYQL